MVVSTSTPPEYFSSPVAVIATVEKVPESDSGGDETGDKTGDETGGKLGDETGGVLGGDDSKLGGGEDSVGLESAITSAIATPTRDSRTVRPTHKLAPSFRECPEVCAGAWSS